MAIRLGDHRCLALAPPPPGPVGHGQGVGSLRADDSRGEARARPQGGEPVVGGRRGGDEGCPGGVLGGSAGGEGVWGWRGGRLLRRVQGTARGGGLGGWVGGGTSRPIEWYG